MELLVAKNLFTFSFKRFPAAFLVFLLIVLILEKAIFSKAWIFADWNTIVILHKKEMLKDPRGYDIVFFGDSVLWSLDAKMIQDRLPEPMTVYNYYVANLGPSFNMSMTVRQYLSHKEKPKLILVSLKPKYFYHSGDIDFEKETQVVQFRRYIEPVLFAKSLPFRKGRERGRYNLQLFLKFLGVLKEYAIHLLSSYDYRVLLRELGPPFLLAGDRTREMFALDQDLERLRINRRFLDYLREHHGQLMLESDAVVPAETVGMDLPARSDTVTNPDLEKILIQANDIGVPVIFFWMPMWKERYEALGGEAYLRPIRFYLQALQRKYARFKFYSLKNPLYEGDNFLDAVHLNRKGAEKFNREIALEFPELVQTSLGRKA